MSDQIVNWQEGRLFSRFEKRNSLRPQLLNELNPQQKSSIRNYILHPHSSEGKSNQSLKGIIMIDLDINILNNEYQIENEHELVKSIKKLQDAGYLTCLNSSRSARMLREWQQKVGTDCPTFAESGAIVDFYDPKKPDINFQIINDEKAVVFTDELRKKILTEEFKDELKNQGFDNVEVVLCEDKEPEQLIKEFEPKEDDNKKFIIPVNGWTLAKIAVYAKEKTPQGLKHNEGFQNTVANIIKQLSDSIDYGKRQTQHIKYADDDSVLCYPTSLNKTQVWEIMLSYLKNLGINIDSPEAKLKFFHMGDGREDDIHDERVTVYSPGNARQELKDRRAKNNSKTIIFENDLYTKGLIKGLNDIYEKNLSNTS